MKKKNSQTIRKQEIQKIKKPERITRDFINIFEEKKLTLAPLANKSNISNPNKLSLKEDLQKNQKDKLKGDIERMNKKSEQKKKKCQKNPLVMLLKIL